MSNNLEFAKQHMNNDHKSSLIALVEFHKGVKTDDVELVELDYEGMKIRYNNEFLELKYDEKADEKSLEFAVINLCTKAKPKPQTKDLSKEIDEFKKSFKTVLISSINSDNQAIASYAPVFFDGDDIYIFISEVAEHFDALKANPNSAEIMFIEDESKAKTIFARIRLRYKVNAKILDRNDDFDRLFNLLKEHNPKSHVDMFYGIKDFHFVKLSTKGGRFVKGFGAAFSIKEDGSVDAVRLNNPHKIK